MKDRIRELREALGYGADQTSFARKLGVGQSTISAWEKGASAPSQTKYPAFRRLGVNIDWLLNGEGDMFAAPPPSPVEPMPPAEIAKVIALYQRLTPRQRAVLNNVAEQFLKD